MIKVKHLMDAREKDDGIRLWVEPIGLTADLRQWCHVDQVLPHLGPPRRLWDWFAQHPDAYEYFRGKYHETLSHGPYRAALLKLARAAGKENLTLLHQGEDNDRSTAMALYEYLTELRAYCKEE